MNLLFICTHNRCRSILSEAITNKLANGVFYAASAGSEPADAPHPLTLKYLKKSAYDVEGVTSKSWNELENFTPDIVITVCDSAAGETCPLWLGNVPKVHWGLPDPSKVKGSHEEIEAAFNTVIHEIERRINLLLSLQLKNKTVDEIVALMKGIVQNEK